MRLICPNCATQYEVDASAIPPEGRDVQCGTCNTSWFQPPEGTPAGDIPMPNQEADMAPPPAVPDGPDRPPVAPGGPNADIVAEPDPEELIDAGAQDAAEIEDDTSDAPEEREAAIAAWALTAAAAAEQERITEDQDSASSDTTPSLAELAAELSGVASTDVATPQPETPEPPTPEPPTPEPETPDDVSASLAPPELEFQEDNNSESEGQVPDLADDTESDTAPEPFSLPDAGEPIFPEREEPDAEPPEADPADELAETADTSAAPSAPDLSSDPDLKPPFTDGPSLSDFRPDPEGVLAKRLKDRVARAAREKSRLAEGGETTLDPIKAATTAAVAAASAQSVEALPIESAGALPRTQRPRGMDELRPRPKLMAPATPEPRGGSFFSGFLLVVILFAILIAIYLFGDQLSAAIPAIAPFLDVYGNAIDGVRRVIQSTIGGLLGG